MEGITDSIAELKFVKHNGFLHYNTNNEVVYVKMIFYPDLKCVEDFSVCSLLSDLLGNI